VKEARMARFFEFEDQYGELLINVDKIIRVSKWDDASTRIYFSKDDYVVVNDTLANVKTRLTFGQKA
jgi:hypothetical protein